jgi:hypothetical protein
MNLIAFEQTKLLHPASTWSVTTGLEAMSQEKLLALKIVFLDFGQLG